MFSIISKNKHLAYLVIMDATQKNTIANETLSIDVSSGILLADYKALKYYLVSILK